MDLFENDGTTTPTQTIEVSSFSWGQTNSGSSSTGGGGEGKVTFKEFKITKKTDSSSIDLFNRCATGAHIPRVVIREVKSGNQQPYLVFTFGLIFVKTIDWAGSSGDDVPTESIVFDYGAVQIQYHSPTGETQRSQPFQIAVIPPSVSSQVIYEPPFPPKGW
jgi:type VI secretion system secreted protein Hcp